ncbi:Protein of unknown function [Pseudomonas asturiensis]|uniref:DUF2559 domain-containing protein n=1 Tax=Pseudomonas asturiensis TaxID=1190415 RepID=A0A1M7MZA5_9PSED|nr:YhfG family protein [Pseudomonas asturiensis]SHM96458.1 Protein of unknown function [Pseudomonas asturiensis]
MPTLSIQAKKAHFAKVRRSNYAASLRLEGYSTTPLDAERPLATREELLNIYRNKQA